MSVNKTEMLFGVGEVYVSNIRIGNLKNATFTYTKEFVEGKPGDNPNIIRRDLTKESAVLTGTLCDINISRIPMLMGLTMSTTQLTATNTMRIVEEFLMPASVTTASTPAKTLAEHAVSETNAKIYTLDYQTQLVKGTDYTITNSTSTSKTKIRPKSASIKNKYYKVAYDYKDPSALTVNVGGKTTHEELRLKFVHKMSDGKHIQIEIPKAQVTGEFSMPFSADNYIEVPVSFTAVGDMTAALGTQLFTIIKER